MGRSVGARKAVIISVAVAIAGSASVGHAFSNEFGRLRRSSQVDSAQRVVFAPARLTRRTTPPSTAAPETTAPPKATTTAPVPSTMRRLRATPIGQPETFTLGTSATTTPTTAPTTTPTTAGPTTTTKATTPVTITPPAPPIGGVITSVKIANAANGPSRNVPITFGMVFRPGDVARGAVLGAKLSSGSTVPIQVDAKATHADGSLRHAVITALLPSFANGASDRIDLVNGGTATSGSAPTIAQLLGTNYDANVQLNIGGTSYTASARALLQSGGAQATTWLSGPLVSEWIVNAAVVDSSGRAHPHLTARFNVRAYAGTDIVRSDVVIENAWAFQANPQNVTYDASIRLAGTEVYKKSALTHYHHARWRKVFWSGAGGTPSVDIAHDPKYLVSTAALPNYDLSETVPESKLNELAFTPGDARYEPMGIGLAYAYMPGTGGRPDIAQLPLWAVQYLYSQDARAKRAMLGTADAAATWSIHYRDQRTGRPVQIADYPAMWIDERDKGEIDPKTGKSTPMPKCLESTACQTPYTFDTAHQPAFAYLPYVVTGDQYYLEELEFWSTYNLASVNPVYRNFENGWVDAMPLIGTQQREQAWNLRTLAQAAYVAPDTDPMKGYFSKVLDSNLDHYIDEYVTNPKANKLGWIGGYLNARPDGTWPGDQTIWAVAPWQNDMFTQVLGSIRSMGFPKAEPVAKFAATFAMKRMTTPGFCWQFATIYQLVIGDGASGPYTDLAQAFVPTMNYKTGDGPQHPNAIGKPCGTPEMNDAAGISRDRWFDGYSPSQQGYPAIMQGALATAVELGMPGARDAYNKVVSRPEKSPWDGDLWWNVVPRS